MPGISRIRAASGRTKRGTLNRKKTICLITDTKVTLFKDHFLHFQIKIKFRKKIARQGSVRLPDADFFWIIPGVMEVAIYLCLQFGLGKVSLVGELVD